MWAAKKVGSRLPTTLTQAAHPPRLREVSRFEKPCLAENFAHYTNQLHIAFFPGRKRATLERKLIQKRQEILRVSRRKGTDRAVLKSRWGLP
jgi:hypothetical protein